MPRFSSITVRPCSPASNINIQLNTTGYSDGPHQVQLAAVNAADNETRSSAVSVNFDNTPPSAPVGISLGGPQWSSSPMTVNWTNPSQGTGSPIAKVHWQACKSGVGCSAVQTQTSNLTSLTFDPTTTAPFSSSPNGGYTISVWLEDAAGNTSQANAASVTPGYSTINPAPVIGLTLSPAGSSSPSTTGTWQTPAGDGGAPYTGVTWSWCGDGQCTSGGEGAPLYLQAAGPGQWTLTVRTVDAAGNVSAPASVTFSYAPSNGGAPLPSPGPGSTTGGGKGLAAQLILNTPKVRHIPSRTVVSVSGRVEAGHGMVAVRVYYLSSRGRDRQSRARRTVVRGGRFEATVPLPGRDRVRFVVVTFVDPTQTYATTRRCAAPRGAPARFRRLRVC